MWKTGTIPLHQTKKLPGNPRGSHRIGALVRSIRRHGFGQPVTINSTTGHVVAGNGRLAALRQMKADGEQPPAGITAKGKSWIVPAYFAQWSTDREAEAALALNGGAHGSLEGDLDGQVVAEILARADEEARLALGLTEQKAVQILEDHAAPLVAPVLNLDGLERTVSHADVAETATIRLEVPTALAERVRAQLRAGMTAADLLTRALDG